MNVTRFSTTDIDKLIDKVISNNYLLTDSDYAEMERIKDEVDCLIENDVEGLSDVQLSIGNILQDWSLNISWIPEDIVDPIDEWLMSMFTSIEVS
jgi:hypothetical protein